MSLHQLVANARWKFGKHPVWLSIFLSSLQLCCVKSQTQSLECERLERPLPARVAVETSP